MSYGVKQLCDTVKLASFAFIARVVKWPKYRLTKFDGVFSSAQFPLADARYLIEKWFGP